MTWFTAGTIAIVNGSDAVTGTGTGWSAQQILPGFALATSAGVILGEIETVNSPTSLTLVNPISAASAAGIGYMIVPTRGSDIQIYNALSQLIADYASVRDNAGQGMFGDGSAAAPGMRFLDDQDTGMWRPSANVIAWALGGTEKLRLDATGLGIGTTPAAKLDVLTSGGRVQVHQAVNFTGTRVLSVNSGNTAAAPMEVSGAGVHITNSANSAVASFLENGNVGIGTASPVALLDLGGGGAGQKLLIYSAGNTRYGLGFGDSQMRHFAASNGALTFGHVSTTDGATFTERMRLDTNGNLLVGMTGGSYHTIAKAAAVGDTIFGVLNATDASRAVMFHAGGDVAETSGAACVLRVSRNAASGRSINAAGTVNGSGADPAEYWRRALGCGTILSGQICGLNADNELTTAWSDAVRFGVKSGLINQPFMVGNDVYAREYEAAAGPAPVKPVDIAAAPTEPIAPEPFVVPEPVLGEGEDDIAFAYRLVVWTQAAQAAASAMSTYMAAVSAYPAALASWTALNDAYQADLATFEAADAVWQAGLEAERQRWDRVSIGGQVYIRTEQPCEAGDYVIPVQDGDGIGFAFVPDAEVTFEQYRRKVGVVLTTSGEWPLIEVIRS